MNTIIAILNGSIMAALGILHLYWMVGGRRGLDQALPTNESGERRIVNPGPVACVIVAVGLLGFALYYFSIGLDFPLGLPFGAEKWGLWVVGGIFTLRAIGDFRYIGFFKKVKNTQFGRMDTRWYAPLCAWLGLTSFWLASS